jgi:hypothetical protein
MGGVAGDRIGEVSSYVKKLCGERLPGGERCPKIMLCRSGGMADAEDSKSSGLTPV